MINTLPAIEMHFRENRLTVMML